MDLSPQSWSDWATGKKAIRKRYRRVWDIPLIHHKQDPIRRQLHTGMSLLDIGAGDGEFGRKVLKGIDGIQYFSMDVDPNQPQNFRSMDEITGKYDCILLMEVIEHLEMLIAHDTLVKIGSFLREDGILALSTPNIHNPALFMSDPTHCLYLNYESLGALLYMSGFEVQDIYRTYSASILKRWSRWLTTPLFKLLNLDYSASILVLAKKRENG